MDDIKQQIMLLNKYGIDREYNEHIHGAMYPVVFRDELNFARVDIDYLLNKNLTPEGFKVALEYDYGINCKNFLKKNKIGIEYQFIICDEKIEYAKYIKGISEEAFLRCINKDLNTYFNIKKKSKKADELYLKLKLEKCKEFKLLNEKQLIKLIKNNAFNLLYIENISEKMYLAALSKSALSFGKVSPYLNLDYTWKKNILEKNGNAIKYIKDQTAELQLIALKNNIHCIRFIKESFEETQIYIIKNNFEKVHYLKNLTPKAKKIYNVALLMNKF